MGSACISFTPLFHDRPRLRHNSVNDAIGTQQALEQNEPVEFPFEIWRRKRRNVRLASLVDTREGRVELEGMTLTLAAKPSSLFRDGEVEAHLGKWLIPLRELPFPALPVWTQIDLRAADSILEPLEVLGR